MRNRENFESFPEAEAGFNSIEGQGVEWEKTLRAAEMLEYKSEADPIEALHMLQVIAGR